MSRIAKGSLITSFLLGSLLFAEFFLFTWHWSLPRDVLLMGFAANPHTVVDDTPISAMGFAGDEIELTKPPGTLRILTLGGSALFNRGMTTRLKRRLQDVSKQNIQVVGAALRSHTTMSSVLKYRVLRKYDFDWVLIYHGINDLWANRVPIEDFHSDYSHLDARYKRNLLLDHCILCRLVYNELLYTGPTPRSRMNLSGFASERPFKRNILTLVESIRRDGGTPILMTFAWSIPSHYTYEAFESRTLGYNNPEDYDRWPVELWGTPEVVREGLQRHNRVLHELAESQRVLLVDQETLMGKDLRWFGDPCHLSDEGTDRFIENIVAFVVEQDLLQ